MECAINNFANNVNTQESIQGEDTVVTCNDETIYISASNDILTKHLCSDVWQIDSQDESCVASLNKPQNIPSSMSGSDISPLVPSMFGISGIVIAFIVLCFIVYCFGIKYSEWSGKQSNNETEEVIGDVLDEIAKYTIGGDSDDLYVGDWMNENSDSTNSNNSDQEELGIQILKVVSHHTLPQLNDSYINDFISSSDSSEEEENENDIIECAKQTLYSSNFYGITQTKLQTIKESVTRETCDNYKRSEQESSDCKILSSDACNNSDLNLP